ncbi:phytoene desaturase family protein [Curtobacterium sp. Leaf261]|uniref:phytoene desaturase family protein n=1 Tax=Curtobacterium sp. Leaf261 TaxID=1736311 RepID=UPI000700B6DB|nr:NAD(P)/FAD-dependent oxidoreductase [Curtobacterium sp. Leaf261]KQO64989.1 dehydrogenase [Curtobacterium sp. Leaf261]
MSPAHAARTGAGGDGDDAIVVGAGPNGLAAAVVLARAGLRVTVLERDDRIGGGARTEELTLPGFRHDICSAVHPMGAVSGFFRRFQLDRRIRMITPDISYAHPLDGGRAGIAHRSLAETAAGLGPDGPAFARLVGGLVRNDDALAEFSLSSLLQIPRHPATMVRFGLAMLDQGLPWWNARWRGEEAPAMLAGVMAHAIRPMPSPSASAAGLALAVHAHARGWPVPEGGSQSIVDAMAADIVAHGGTIETGIEVSSLDEVAGARVSVFDVSARAMADIGGERLPSGYAMRLRRFRYGNAASKVDFALSQPVPWTNEAVRRSPTVHLGGTRAEVARAENDVAAGRHARDPFVLVVQQGAVDPSRAPAGKAALWAYTHVPAGSTIDQTEVITAAIERYAPGFRDTILASTSRTATDLEFHNPNYVGGDIATGAPSVVQLAARPIVSTDPWRTPVPGVYLGSASTPPGPSVHGLGGAYAARSALRHEFGLDLPDLSIDGHPDPSPHRHTTAQR